LQPRVVSAAAILRGLAPMLRRLIGEDIELDIVSSEDEALVKVDPGQLEQVIVNLAVNARDAMPRGGRLVIETGGIDLEAEAAARLGALSAGPHVTIAVTDSGVGMDEDTRAHIFEPFFTTKEVGKGTGLGLATVYGVVKQSGGYIWVESETNRGTIVRIAFPVVAGAVQVRELAPPRVEPAPAGETVLLVEDEEAVRRVAAKTLVASGYRVLSAKDGPEALTVAAGEPGTINLLLTDIVMPGMTGRELAERLAAVRPATRVLFMSGYTEDVVVRATAAAAGSAFLQKPFDPEALARKVREVLDGRTASR
jgi:two-component system, cell cycle sensor histidine kinase and response regulator CckA